MKVTDTLVEHFPKVMDLKFTRHMEDELDQIEIEEVERNEVSTSSTSRSRSRSKVAETKMLADAEKCPQCGKPLAANASASSASSSAAPAIPSASTSRRKAPSTSQAPEPPKHDRASCAPTAGKPMLQRTGKRGPFLGCSGYPDCKTTMNFDAEGKPVNSPRKSTEHVCEKCGKPMVAARRAARPVPRLHRLSQVPERRRTSTPRATPSSRSTPASTARSAAAPWASRTSFARPVPRLQRLPEMPQHQEDDRRAEGEAQGPPAAAAAEEGGDRRSTSPTPARSAARR